MPNSGIVETRVAELVGCTIVIKHISNVLKQLRRYYAYRADTTSTHRHLSRRADFRLFVQTHWPAMGHWRNPGRACARPFAPGNTLARRQRIHISRFSAAHITNTGRYRPRALHVLSGSAP